MSPVEALQMALEQEENALKTYKELAYKHKEIQELLYMLANEEEKHKKLIEKKIAELTRI